MIKIIKKDGPFTESPLSTRKIMRNLIIALIPIMLFSFYKNGIIPYQKGYVAEYGLWYPLIRVFVAALASFLMELFYQIIFMKRGKKSQVIFDIKNNYSFIPGIFIGLILPYNAPLYMIIIGAVLATLVGKLLFGGFGNNIFNPALIGVLFVTILYGGTIANLGGVKNPYELDTISSATPLTNMNMEGHYATYENLVEPYGSFGDFFVGTIPGSPAETSAALCIAAFLFLVLTKTIKWRIPLYYVGTVFALTSILGMVHGADPWYGLFHILSGGLLFGAVFMATDPVTSPTTSKGQILFGISLGILTVLFRFISSYPEGIMLSILMMNMFVFLLDRIGYQYSNNKKVLTTPIVILVILASIPFFYKAEEPEVRIITKDINGMKIEYVASTTGNDGELKARIVINEGNIETIEILEIKDTYYSSVKNANFIDRFLNNQSKLEQVDTISGATVTSTAIKRLIIFVVEDYNNSNLGIKVGEKLDSPAISITDKRTAGENTIYTVRIPNMQIFTELSITIDNSGVIQEILFINKEMYDPYNFDYLHKIELLEDSGYLESIIQKQDDLDSVLSHPEAPELSQNVKKAVMKTVEEWISKNEE